MYDIVLGILIFGLIVGGVSLLIIFVGNLVDWFLKLFIHLFSVFKL